MRLSLTALGIGCIDTFRLLGIQIQCLKTPLQPLACHAHKTTKKHHKIWIHPHDHFNDRCFVPSTITSLHVACIFGLIHHRTFLVIGLGTETTRQEFDDLHGNAEFHELCHHLCQLEVSLCVTHLSHFRCPFGRELFIHGFLIPKKHPGPCNRRLFQTSKYLHRGPETWQKYTEMTPIRTQWHPSQKNASAQCFSENSLELARSRRTALRCFLPISWSAHLSVVEMAKGMNGHWFKQNP